MPLHDCNCRLCVCVCVCVSSAPTKSTHNRGCPIAQDSLCVRVSLPECVCVCVCVCVCAGHIIGYIISRQHFKMSTNTTEEEEEVVEREEEEEEEL